MLKKENLKSYIDELIKEVEEELEEANVTGNVDGYQTPFAFSGKSASQKRKKTATQLGYTLVNNDVKNIDEVNEATASEIIKDLDKVRNDLIKKVDVLIAKKKKLYSNVDIESPMSADEKQLDKDIQSIFSQIQQIIQQKRKIKESVNEDKVYIDFLNKKKGFKQDRIKFNSYEEAVKWARKNFDKFDPDMIKYESVNEGKSKRPVNRWLELKNDESMHANKKLAVGLKELKHQLSEVEKFFRWYNQIKTMNELSSDVFWKRTHGHIYKIKERLINIAKTIQEIEK
jgi:hypothetical protein